MNGNERTRHDLMAALVTLGQLRPDWRVGQMLANLAMTAGRLDAGGVWDLEDGEALAAAWVLIEQHSADATEVETLSATAANRV